MVRLQSVDGVVFEIDGEIANSMGTIKEMLENCGDEETIIPVPAVKSTILRKVLDYAEHYKDCCPSETKPPDPQSQEIELNEDDSDEDINDKPIDEISQWDAEFLQGMEQHTLFELISAANFLNIKGLFDVGCRTVANMIKGKSTEAQSEAFDVQMDSTSTTDEDN